MAHNGPRNGDPLSSHIDPQNPYDALLSIDLQKKWTDTQLDRHILQAVKYGVRMERERILSATKDLTYLDEGLILNQEKPLPGGAV